jgi:hypothetical protein
MTRSPLLSDLRSDFNNFLFAPIRDDKNGTLSVLSALARLDVDPWELAAKLAALPREAAIQKLATLLGALPAESAADPQSQATAARLVALLPQGVNSKSSAHKDIPRAARSPRSATATYLVYCVIFVLFVLISQWLFGSHDAPLKVEQGSPSETNGVTPQPPAPGSNE